MKILNKIIAKKWFWPLISIAMGILLAYPLFGAYFFSPNSHMFAFGGDALTLYYNVTYHTCYGSGDHLTSMNYPKGELIYLTDAQGALSVVLSFINRHLFNTCAYSVGIVNSLMVLSYIFSSYLLYNIFTALGLVNWRSSIFAALTAIMAPQVQRITSHFGLSYTFLLPLCIIWMIRKYRLRKIEIRDFVFLLILIFFTFNNPYVGFTACMFIVLTGVIFFYFNRKEISKTLCIISLGAIPITIAFAYFKIFDPFDDRLKQQWGYFDLKSTFEGFISPPNSMADKILKVLFGKGFNVGFEASVNLTLPISAILIGFLIVKIFKPQLISDFKLGNQLKIMFFASFILFLYASGIVFLPFSNTFVENKLGFLLMFKAVARMSWPFWYLAVIIALVLLEQLLKKVSLSGYLYTITLVISLWFLDYKVYRKPAFNDTVHPNFFSKSENQYLEKLLLDKNFKVSDYQAILALPKLMFWTDHFSSDFNFFNQFIGMRYSVITGLPMISSMLSRMSIGETAEKIEFISNPLIEKSLHKNFPNKKDILVIRGKGDPALKSGESYILSLCDTLIEEKEFTVLRLSFEKINKYELTDSLKKDLIVPTNMYASNFYLNNYDDQKNQSGYFSDGSLFCKQSETLVGEYSTAMPFNDTYVFSAWTKIQTDRYGLGNWKIETLDSLGNLVTTQYPSIFNSNDVHDDWVRSEEKVIACKKCRYKFYYCNKNNSYIDELLFRPSSEHVWDKNRSFYNGFKIK